MPEVEARRLTCGEELRLAEELGRDGQSRKGWETTKVIASVRKIDGKAVMRPQVPAHLRDILRRAGGKVADIVAAWPVPEVVDETRDITATALDEIEQIDFFEAFGALADIPPFAGLAYIACSVRSIDGEPIAMPTNTKDMRALVDRLGDVGMNRANDLIGAALAPSEKDEAAEIAAAKK